MPNEKIGIVVFANENHFGDNVSNLVTAFVYDLLLGKVNNIDDYSEALQGVKNKVAAIQKAYHKDREIRAKREWILMHNFKDYIGVYKNEDLGDLIISVKDGEINAKIGISEAIASPSSNDESIRVEFRNGSGSEILFVSDKNGAMAAVYSGKIFLK